MTLLKTLLNIPCILTSFHSRIWEHKLFSLLCDFGNVWPMLSGGSFLCLQEFHLAYVYIHTQCKTGENPLSQSPDLPLCAALSSPELSHKHSPLLSSLSVQCNKISSLFGFLSFPTYFLKTAVRQGVSWAVIRAQLSLLSEITFQCCLESNV